MMYGQKNIKIYWYLPMTCRITTFT